MSKTTNSARPHRARGCRWGSWWPHVGALAVAFAAAAEKDLGPLTDTPPEEVGGLEPDWRTSYPAQLAALAQAWRRPDTWTGISRAGGVDLPGEVAGSVALAEVVIHGWDVARATHQPYGVDAATAAACLTHLAQFEPSGTEGLFEPAVAVPGWRTRHRSHRGDEWARPGVGPRLSAVVLNRGTLGTWIRSARFARSPTSRTARVRTRAG